MKRFFGFKHARLTYGIMLFLLGIIFSLLPIPIGYLCLFLGAYLLQHQIPFFRRIFFWLKEKDRKGKLQRFEQKVDDLFSDRKKEEDEEEV